MTEFEEVTQIIQEASDAVNRNTSLIVSVSNILDINKETARVKVYSFDLQALGELGWLNCGTHYTHIRDDGLIQVPFVDGEDDKWERLLRQIQPLNKKSQNILRIAYWIYSIVSLARP